MVFWLHTHPPEHIHPMAQAAIAEKRYCSWEFSIDGSKFCLNVDEHIAKMTEYVRYVAYYHHDKMVIGYVYIQDRKSQCKMESVVWAAVWKPIVGQLQHNTEYCDLLSTGILTEVGVAPAQGKRSDLTGVSHKKRKTVDTTQQDDAERKIVELTKQLTDANQVNAELREQMGTTARNMMDLVTAYFQRDMRKTNRDLSFVLQRIYQLQPPLREDARFISSSTREGLAAALVKAKLHYHPDKQGIGDFWRTSICTEISKFLNFAQEQFNGTVYDWK
jgi:hypothetical protein